MISIIIPCYNEEESIGGLLENISMFLRREHIEGEVIVVDDSSSDRTAEIANTYDVQVLRHPRQLGYGAALKTGIYNAKGEIIIFLDGDGSYPVNEIKAFIEQLNNFDLVIGNRSRTHHAIKRRFGNYLFAIAVSYIVGKKVSDPTSGMRAMKREVSLLFDHLTDGFSFSASSTIEAARHGFRFVEIPIPYYKRKGTSKLSPLKDGLKIAFLVLRLTVEYAPLKVFFPIGLSVLLSGLFFTIYSVLLQKNITDLDVLVLVTGLQIIIFALFSDLVVRRLERFEKAIIRLKRSF